MCFPLLPFTKWQISSHIAYCEICFWILNVLRFNFYLSLGFWTWEAEPSEPWSCRCSIMRWRQRIIWNVCERISGQCIRPDDFWEYITGVKIYIDLAAFGDKVFNGVIKLKWDHVDLTLIQYEWCSYKRD